MTVAARIENNISQDGRKPAAQPRFFRPGRLSFSTLRFRVLLLVLLLAGGMALAYVMTASRLMLDAGVKESEGNLRQTAELLNLAAASSLTTGNTKVLQAFLDAMLMQEEVQGVFYVAVLDGAGGRVLGAGQVPAVLPAPDVDLNAAVQRGEVHVRSPVLLRSNQVGALQFGYSTRHLVQTLSAMQREGFRIFLMISTGVVLLVLLAGYQVVRRINRLVIVSRGIAAGDYAGVRADERGGDEISLIAHNFNRMADAIERHMAEIEANRVEVQKLNASLEELTIRDALTGLYNRRYLDTQIDRCWDRMRRENDHLAVLMIDVDHFKKYNDHYGHSEGDVCLVKAAGAIQAGLETGSNETGCAAFAARYGGEEFVVVVSQATEESMRCFSDAILSSVRQCGLPHALNEDYGIVTVSIGASLANPASDQISTAFRRADDALYQSKAQGRNRANLFC